MTRYASRRSSNGSLRSTSIPGSLKVRKNSTTGAFATNPFAKNIYRRLGELPDFAKEAEEIALQMGVIAAVEYVLAYMEDMQQLREEIVPDR